MDLLGAQDVGTCARRIASPNWHPKLAKASTFEVTQSPLYCKRSSSKISWSVDPYSGLMQLLPILILSSQLTPRLSMLLPCLSRRLNSKVCFSPITGRLMDYINVLSSLFCRPCFSHHIVRTPSPSPLVSHILKESHTWLPCPILM